MLGPNWAKSMKKGNAAQLEGGWKRGSKVVFWEVSENETRSIVEKLKKKKPTDSDGLDMIIVKKIIVQCVCVCVCVYVLIHILKPS